MKRFIVCFVLMVSIMFGLCACYPTTLDDQGVERTVMNEFVVIRETGASGYVVYHESTKVVYYFKDSSHGDHLSPYFIYHNNALYGAIFQNGEIIPVPYAYAPLD